MSVQSLGSVVLLRLLGIVRITTLRQSPEPMNLGCMDIGYYYRKASVPALRLNALGPIHT